MDVFLPNFFSVAKPRDHNRSQVKITVIRCYHNAVWVVDLTPPHADSLVRVQVRDQIRAAIQWRINGKFINNRYIITKY